VFAIRKPCAVAATAQALGFQGILSISRGRRERAPNPAKIARLRNISIPAVQHAEGRDNPANNWVLRSIGFAYFFRVLKAGTSRDLHAIAD
jgi:hypothetical protein